MRQSIVSPDGHGVRPDGSTGRLVVTGTLGQIVARKGDHIRLSGGMNRDGPEFKACGGVTVDDEP
jgi:hypothetical protein